MARGNNETVADKCRKVRNFVQSFQEKNGYSPSFVEIMSATGIKTRSHVNYILKKLTDDGTIERQGHVARGIKLVSPEKSSVVSVSLLGQVAANSANPLIVHDAYDPMSNVEIPLSMIPAGTDRSQLYALQVKGDSMTDAKIADGDIIILKKGNAWKEGDIVAVWLDKDQGMTLKEIRSGKDGVVN